MRIKLWLTPRLLHAAGTLVTWRFRYGVRRFLRTSFWFWPLMVVAITLFVVLPLVHVYGNSFDPLRFLWPGLNAARSRTILSALTGSTLSFLVFVLSSLVMVVQLASAQLTPRIMEFTLSDNQGKVLTCALLFSFLFGTSTLARIEDDSPPLFAIKLTVIAVLVSILLFLRFVPHLSMSLRPISLMQKIADAGERAIASIYPSPFESSAAERPQRMPRAQMQREGTIIPYTGDPGVFEEFGAMDLVNAAASKDCVIELLASVGNFINRGDPLFLVYPPDAGIDNRTLHHMVAIGRERTLVQDPVFAFRVIVDIANRALSPAINDPTTAVLAIDQLERLLRCVGSRRMDPGMVKDASGTVRLIIPVPDWEDYVHLAVSEVRLYGANSIQVPRRLMAMLENLVEVLPKPRAAALHAERNLLRKAVTREFTDVAERAMVTTGDRQGMGGADI